MEALKITNTTYQLSKSLRRVGDIENDGSPMVVCYYDSLQKFYYFAIWTDCDGNTNRWIYVKLDKNTVTSYMDKKCSLRDVVSKNSYPIIILDKKNNSDKKYFVVNSVPENYVPDNDCYFDSEYCQEESVIRRFISKS